MSDSTPRHGGPGGALTRGEQGGRGLRALWRRWHAWLVDPEVTAAGHLPRFFLLFLLLFGVGMILISLIGDQGLIAYYGLRSEAAALREEVAELEARRIALRQQIQALREDPEYIAQLARQRLGLVKTGEVVLQLPRPQDPR